MLAQATDYTVHAENGGEIGIGYFEVNNTLVDEDGNTLIDEDGNILVGQEFEPVYGQVLHAKSTDYTVHEED